MALKLPAGSLDEALDKNIYIHPGLPHNMVTGFQKRARLKLYFLYDLALKLVQHHFYLILSIETVTKIHQEHKLHLLMEESQHLKRVPHSLFLWH